MSAPVKIKTHPAGSVEWLLQRRTGLGGSEVAAVLGLSPWESRFSLWHRKAGFVDIQTDDAATEWGRRLERVILSRWCDDKPLADVRLDQTFCRDGWQIASPDAVAIMADGTRELVEIKTAQDGTGWGEPGTDQIPVYYLTQVRWYLHVLGLQVARVAVLIRGIDYREYTVTQDADDLALMIREGRAFLDSVEADRRPDIDSHTATYEVVKALHPDIDGETVEIDPAIAAAYLDACDTAKTAEASKRQATSTLADAMGTAAYATHHGDLIARRQARGNGTPYVVATTPKQKRNAA